MTLLFLHAFPLDERMWEPQREPGESNSLLRGGSSATAAPALYSRGATIAEWARSVLAELAGDVVVVGSSVGGYCALEVARQAPERVRALVLVGARAEGDTPERRAARFATIELIRRGGVAPLWDDVAPKLFSPAADERVVARARELALSHSPEELIGAVEAIRDRTDLTEVARSLDVPLLVAVGESDPYFAVDEAEALATSLRRGSLHVFERCGHLPSLERTREFNAVLRAFLQGL